MKKLKKQKKQKKVEPGLVIAIGRPNRKRDDFDDLDPNRIDNPIGMLHHGMMWGMFD